MRDIALRPGAEIDIEMIADYTIEQWGLEQARRYIAELQWKIDDLSGSALRYSRLDDVVPGLRKARSGHHFIYFFVADDLVDVVRILHERMDVQAELN